MFRNSILCWNTKWSSNKRKNGNHKNKDKIATNNDNKIVNEKLEVESELRRHIGIQNHLKVQIEKMQLDAINNECVSLFFIFNF